MKIFIKSNYYIIIMLFFSGCFDFPEEYNNLVFHNSACEVRDSLQVFEPYLKRLPAEENRARNFYISVHGYLIINSRTVGNWQTIYERKSFKSKLKEPIFTVEEKRG